MIHALFFWVVLIGIWIGPSVLTARLAARKGRSFVGYLIAALLISWVLVLLVVLVVPDRGHAA
jgi:hypothetical protein